MEVQETFRMHRFRDTVAIHFSDTKTLYLTPAMAHTLGEFMQEFALDVHNTAFTDSALTTKTVTKEGLIS